MLFVGMGFANYDDNLGIPIAIEKKIRGYKP
jgi:hypothetical protein